VATKSLTQTEEEILRVSATENLRPIAENPQQKTVQRLEDRNNNNKQRQHGILPSRLPHPAPGRKKQGKDLQ